MEQRIEFALKGMRTLNFWALCQEYGLSAKTGYKVEGALFARGSARDGRTIAPAAKQSGAAAGGRAVRDSAA